MAVSDILEYQQSWVEGLNRGDVSAADESFASDCIIHLTGVADPIVGVEAWKAAVAGFLAAFPDIQFTMDEQITVGDTTAMRWHARGTHKGPLGPIAATGRSVAFCGLIVDHLVAGKVQERWEQLDQPLILQQIGAA